LEAVEEGKCIFLNIKNFLVFQLSTSCGALIVVALATLLGLPNPLNAMQILWINIICDGPVAQSLGVEPKDLDTKTMPPRRKNEQITSKLLIFRVISTSLLMVLGTITVFYDGHKDGDITSKDRTRTFTCLVLFDLWNSLSCRSESKSIFKIGFFTNRMYNYAFMFVFLGQILVVYTPFLQSIFKTDSLTVYEWIFLIAVTSIIFWFEELRKIYHTTNKERSEYFRI
jgi:Ca2+-transporting ATPase